jgi:histone H3/H4
LADPGTWRRCSACKQPIALGASYWVCNVSTCNRARTALAFCSLTCWEVHLPEAHHREAWALERTAPRTPEAGAAPPPRPAASGPPATPSPAAAERKGERRIVRPAAASSRPAAPREILIIASRLKEYIRARSGFHASDGVLDPLSDAVRHLCDEAILKAEREGRRTVLERDVPEV